MRSISALRPGQVHFTDPVVLGLEGGATRTTVALAGGDDSARLDFELGPSNLRLMSDRDLLMLLGEAKDRLPVPVKRLAAVAFGLAGVRTDSDRERIRQAASRIFPRVPCVATDDLQTALAAAPPVAHASARVLILSGTGSCCFGIAADGRQAKVGGRGHVIGDRGSACDIGLQALRELTAVADRFDHWPVLGALILDALCLSTPEDLVEWSLLAGKSGIGALAVTVFRAAERRDPLARRILSAAAKSLATDAIACASRLARPGDRVQFVLNGGVLLKNPSFRRTIAKLVRLVFRNAVMTPVPHASVDGALILAQSLVSSQHQPNPLAPRQSKTKKPAAAPPVIPSWRALTTLRESPTENRNPRSTQLDTMPLERAVGLMLDEESQISAALWKERRVITVVVRRIITAFHNNGRLFYVGAGTSGRLGVLDASECPPTFRTPPEQVQGIIAGGQRALWTAVEGAEDDAEAGATAVAHRRISPHDVIIGITASGRTPYVWGALAEADHRKATTVLLCFNPEIKKAITSQPKPAYRPDFVLAPDVGPEVLTGSTRLKAGTATKLILNIFSTLAMSRTGKVLSNLMVDVNPSNEKLRDRAERIIMALGSVSRDRARTALTKSGWVVKKAYESLNSK